MILGMTTSTFTTVHVLISLVAIGSGFIVVFGMLKAKRLDGWTALFLATTVLTSVTGFFFPNEHITPGIVIGILSLILLALAILARYPLHLSGAWSRTYAITATISLYLNVFVLVAQCFAKVPSLHALAPTQKEAPFMIAQLIVLALFVALTIAAARGFSKGEAAYENRPRRAA
jgi:hypothetical protein